MKNDGKLPFEDVIDKMAKINPQIAAIVSFALGLQAIGREDLVQDLSDEAYRLTKQASAESEFLNGIPLITSVVIKDK